MTTKTYDVAVVGATGAVGREMLSTLAERDFPVKNVYALASKNSASKVISYGENKDLTVSDVEKFDFSRADIALFSAGSALSETLAPKAADEGCIVIDNSSLFRMDEDVPLIIPEVNGALIKDWLKNKERRNIIANPNCSTAQMVVALKPLHDAYKIRRVVVSTYQSVSGAGRPAMDELFNQTRGVFVNDFNKPEIFTKEIAFNLIPHIDAFMDDGFTKEEWKMAAETKKILDPAIDVVAHCVRVPVFIGHSEAIFISCEKPVDVDEARDKLREADGIAVIDYPNDEGYVTPKESAGEDAVFISRLRRDPTIENGLIFWCVSDNLRKGAALNSVQIAEECVKYGL